MMFLVVIFLLCVSVSVTASSGGITVVANVRGKKYTVVAETVEEFTEKTEGLADLQAGQQSVLFRGKVLNPEDRLEDIGVQENGIYNLLIMNLECYVVVCNFTSPILTRTSRNSVTWMLEL